MKVCTACSAEYGDEVLFCQRDGTPLRPSVAGKALKNRSVHSSIVINTRSSSWVPKFLRRATAAMSRRKSPN